MACAFSYRSGEIGFREDVAGIPKGTIVFAYGDIHYLKNMCATRARHAYDNKTLLVPGVPEAATDKEAFEAFQDWQERTFPDQILLHDGVAS